MGKTAGTQKMTLEAGLTPFSQTRPPCHGSSPRASRSAWSRKRPLARLFFTSAILAVFDSKVFITAIESSRSMQRFTSEIAWGSEFWIAEDADHLTHFSGEAIPGV